MNRETGDQGPHRGSHSGGDDARVPGQQHLSQQALHRQQHPLSQMNAQNLSHNLSQNLLSQSTTSQSTSGKTPGSTPRKTKSGSFQRMSSAGSLGSASGLGLNKTKSPFKTPATGSAATGPTNSGTNSSTTTSTTAHTVFQDSTTPAYGESTVLVSKTHSKDRVHLSELEPIDKSLLDRIKGLEISIRQHKDYESHYRKEMDHTRSELEKLLEEHGQLMEEMTAEWERFGMETEALQRDRQDYSRILQELKEKSFALREEIQSKEEEIQELRDEWMEQRQRRDQILKERIETEGEALDQIRMEKAKLLREFEEIEEMKRECDPLSNRLVQSYGRAEVEALERSSREKDARIWDLERRLEETQYSLMIEAKNADTLVALFEKVYDRRIQSQKEEFAQALAAAEATERSRDEEANQALENYLRINQLAVEAEEKASREEFSLLSEREDLEALREQLLSLRAQMPTVQTRVDTVMD